MAAHLVEIDYLEALVIIDNECMYISNLLLHIE